MGASGDKDPIVIEVGKYNKIVNKIEKESKALLDKKEYVDYEDNTQKNGVIPVYTINYMKAIDAIDGFQNIDTKLVKLMRTVRDNYKNVDAAASGKSDG